MSAPECRRLGNRLLPEAKRQTCIEALADGWIGAPDLCPSCTAAFMAALDGISGPLGWHQAYRERACNVSPVSVDNHDTTTGEAR